MEVTGCQIEATHAQMNNMIAAYSCNLIALKKLQPSPSIPIDEDFQPFKNMTDAVEPVIERLIDEAIVQEDNDTRLSNHVSPRQQDDSDIPQFQTSYVLNLTKKKEWTMKADLFEDCHQIWQSDIPGSE